MSEITIAQVAGFLDTLLGTSQVPDYPNALNGMQVGHRGPIKRVAVAVDCSLRTILLAAADGANLLVVHHGLFWNGLQPLTGAYEARVRTLLEHDIALYSSHLPLDAHATFGNSRLLALELGLEPTAGFAKHHHLHCGVRGTSDLETTHLIERVQTWATPLGQHTVASMVPSGHRTRRWAICTGAGAQPDSLAEAYAGNIDTLIVGEGPHWSAIDAEEHGLVIIYAGHYATETTGVRALGAHLAREFSLPWTFIHAPTGL